MKSLITPACIALSLTSVAQVPTVTHVGVQATNLNLRGAPVVLDSAVLVAPVAGTAVVHFDGVCISSPGDRIILAASDIPDWSVNDGNTAVEALDSDVDRNPFSHTRVYSITAGTHSFYAVGENFVETDGSGIASVFGSLSVEYFPNVTGGPFAVGVGMTFNGDVRTAEVAIDSVEINAPDDGKVVVRFDGSVSSSIGDLIVLAASDTTTWATNDGNVGVQAYDNDLNSNPFSHTRTYDVTAGSHWFYAVVQNFVLTGGDGMVWVYGTLTAEYFPNSADADVEMEGVATSNMNLRGAPVVLDSVTVSSSGAGWVEVQFDGGCNSSVGDRIILAASDTVDWSTNDGNTNYEALFNGLHEKSFSHTRVYPVTAGSFTYYAIGENFVETDGPGTAYCYGSLTAKYFPSAPSGMESVGGYSSPKVYPNPAADVVVVEADAIRYVQLLNAHGELLQHVLGRKEGRAYVDLSSYSAGTYLVRVVTSGGATARPVVKM